jgi:hypothetical protein
MFLRQLGARTVTLSSGWGGRAAVTSQVMQELGDKLSLEETQAFINLLDKNGDGAVSIDEFHEFFMVCLLDVP